MASGLIPAVSQMDPASANQAVPHFKRTSPQPGLQYCVLGTALPIHPFPT